MRPTGSSIDGIRWWVLAGSFLLAVPALAQVVSYEATSFPEEEGWVHLDHVLQGDRSLDDGWLVQVVDIVDPGPPEDPEVDSYNRSIAEFALSNTFFVEWRVESDGPSEAIQAAAPAVLSAFGQSGVLYHFTIADDQMRFIQDVSLPLVFVDIEPGVPHTYRLEVQNADHYEWYIDGQLHDSGLPEGPYPSSDSKIIFRCKAGGIPTTTCWWDYIRFGVIPANASGDFNSDGEVDEFDAFYFEECLTTPACCWPGCAWGDFDADGDTDCDDAEAFAAAWTGEGEFPAFAQCQCPTDLDGSGSVGASDLALLLGAWGECTACAADLNDDGSVDSADLALLLGAWGPCP